MKHEPTTTLGRALSIFAKKIETARTDALFGNDHNDLGPAVDDSPSFEVSQHFLLALSALEQARIHMRLASIAADKAALTIP